MTAAEIKSEVKTMTEFFRVEAVYENGVLRPDTTLPLAPSQRVSLIVETSVRTSEWPDDTEEIYTSIAAEDRDLAAKSWGHVSATWPREEQP